MFGLEILEVLIGLFLVYFVFSVMASGLTEVVSGILGLRARNLSEGIKTLLQNDQKALDEFYDHPAIKALAFPGDRWLVGRNRPSYIPAKVVSQVCISIREGLDDRTRGFLAKAASVYAGDEIEKVEHLFDATMERAKGWYKRKVAVVVVLFATFVVSMSNADTFAMANSLWQDPVMRDGLVALAEKQQGEGRDIALEDANELRSEVSRLQLLGWREPAPDNDDPRERPDTAWGWLVKIAGLGVTVGAVSMGAPFWFDKISQMLKVKQGLSGSAESATRPDTSGQGSDRSDSVSG